MTIKRISPREALALMEQEGFVYVDVRTPEEFGAGHPAGAVNVPVALSEGGSMVPNASFLDVMKRRFSLDAKIIVGCQAGGRSLRAAQTLEGAGFTRVVDQRAGWGGSKGPFGEIVEQGWAACDLPSGQGQPDERSYDAMKR